MEDGASCSHGAGIALSVVVGSSRCAGLPRRSRLRRSCTGCLKDSGVSSKVKDKNRETVSVFHEKNCSTDGSLDFYRKISIIANGGYLVSS